MINIVAFEYIVWCKSDWKSREWKMYKQNEEKTWWLLPENHCVGFDVQTVAKHRQMYHFFNSEEDAKEFVRVKEYEDQNGQEPAAGEEDFECPSCSRRHAGKDVFSDYGGGYDETPYLKTCLCGATLVVEPFVSVTYSAKEK